MAFVKRLSAWLAIPILVVALAGPGEARVTGKISGVVTDSETGKPVVGATVSVQSTQIATETDEDGEYFIINVPVGEYDLSVSHVGFEKLTKKMVRVLVDLTTPVDFEVKQMAIELPDEVVVYATAPIIQKDLTASRIIFTEDRLRNLPNITSVQSVLTHYPGVVVGSDNNMHVRGGRSDQVSYYYDGFAVEDPFTAAAGIRIMPTSLEELSLTSGGFTAEYGEALSGVVSAVTREGGSKYRGKIRTYQGFTHPYDVSTGRWSELSRVTNRSASFNFSGPILGLNGKRYTFFTAGEYLRDDGYLPHNWTTAYTGTLKLAAQPVPKLKVISNVTYNDLDAGIFRHRDVNGVSYDFNLDGLPVLNRKAYLAGISGNYAMSERAVVSLVYNQFYTRTRSGPAHLKGVHWRDWPGYSEDANGVYNGTIHEDNYWANPDFSDPMQATGFTVGDDFDPSYGYRRTLYNSVAATTVAQLTKTNQIKAGAEYRHYDIQWDFKQFFNSQPYGEQYTSNPVHASVFVEDKLEHKDFIVNMGLRFDYRNADVSYNYTPEDTIARYKKSDSKSRISPRLGVSFPISDKSKMHFNYGVYYQAPLYRYLYTNLDGDRSSGLPQLGNPDLNPERTISYELGLDHLIGNDFRIDVTAYYKDIDELVSTREVGRVAGQPVVRFVNADYGHVSGIDVALEKLKLNGFLSGSISYGYMVAKGSGSTAEEPYYTYITSNVDTLPPLTDYFLDFDQRHTVTAVLDYRVPADWSYDLLGLKIPGAWGLSMVGFYGSGLPYTRTDASGNRLGDRNENRLPANYTVDMRFNKDFFLGKTERMLTFFVEVDNLFNRRNILNVYSRTGLPDDDANRIQPGLTLDAEDVAYYDELYDYDPTNFSAPRTVRTGLELTF